MSDINKVLLTGRLTRDSELRYINTGTAVCTFSIAVNEWNGEKEVANFFDCTLWAKRAEALHEYLVKGRQVMLEGSLKQQRWEKDGQQRSKLEITVVNIVIPSNIQHGQANNTPSGSRGVDHSDLSQKDVKSTGNVQNFDYDWDIPF